VRGEAGRAALPAFAAFPERLAAAVRIAVARPVPEGEWTPEQVVRHLIAVDELVHQARLRDLAAGQGVRWSWTEPGPWHGEPGASVERVLERFAATRADTIALARSLDEAAWRRTGLHETFGPLDADGVLREAAKHDEEHLAALD
jgi:hypothetical protein